MKKFLSLLVVFSFVLTGCTASSDDAGSSDGAEIALVTDAGDINDRSFNQSAWEAVEQYAKETDTTYQYYKPATFDTAGYTASIEQAIENGAKVIVVPGFKFAEAMSSMQTEYPETNFIMIDAAPMEGDAVVPIEDNVYSTVYAEQQSGYLAGYAAVKEGYTKLGFMGGIALPAVVNFGYGFIEGAEAAAAEMGVTVEMKYKYTGTFTATPEIKAEAAAWYNEGTEVIFSCGGGIFSSVFAAAEEADAKTIGVDSDQSEDSETVLTSATKGVNKTVYDALVAYGEGNFPTSPDGVSVLLGAEENYIGLPMDTSRFETFTQADYDTVYATLADLDIATFGANADAAGDPTVIGTDASIVKVTYLQ